MTIAALFILLFVFMLVGMPVAIALGLSSILTILFFAQDSLASLTLKLYAQKKDIPLTGVTVEVKHDASEEQKGKYALHVKLTLKGVLTDAQRDELHNVADKCPVHKLMTTAEITIETHLSEGAFSQ